MLIIGLGNPGIRYEDTRHNIGFMAVDYIALTNGIHCSKKDFHSLWGKGGIKGSDVVLVKPQTYMNLSGKAAQSIAAFFHFEPENILVIYDDVDLEFGAIRVRPNGGSGGHRGMASIIEHLGTNEFPRIRLGIGRPERGDVADYVLSAFTKDERDRLEQIFISVQDAVETILSDGIEKAMNKLNKTKRVE